jgi:hypothetical protein
MDLHFRNLGAGPDIGFLIYWDLLWEFWWVALFWWVDYGCSFLCRFAVVASVARWAGIMFGGSVHYLDMKRSATICTNVHVGICISVKERALRSFCPITEIPWRSSLGPKSRA